MYVLQKKWSVLQQNVVNNNSTKYQLYMLYKNLAQKLIHYLNKLYHHQKKKKKNKIIK